MYTMNNITLVEDVVPIVMVYEL